MENEGEEARVDVANDHAAFCRVSKTVILLGAAADVYYRRECVLVSDAKLSVIPENH